MNGLADRRTVGEVVTRLYTAAGRKVTELELMVYAEVLAGIEADVVEEASRRMVGAEDWRWRPPSPALLLEYVGAVRRERRHRQPAIPPDTGPVVPAEVSRSRVAELRAHFGSPSRAEYSIEPRAIRATAHDLGDHQFCQPGCTGEPDPPAPSEEQP